MSARRIVFIVAFFAVAALVLARAESVNRTATIVPDPGMAMLVRSVFSSFEFFSPRILPKPNFSLILRNNTFVIPPPEQEEAGEEPVNQDKIPQFVADPSCASTFVHGAVEAIPWRTDLFRTTGIVVVRRVVRILTPGKGDDPPFYVDRMEADPARLDVVIFGSTEFRNSLKKTTDYQLFIPGVCTDSDSSPHPVPFRIVYEKRKTEGVVISFSAVPAAIFSLAGSVFAESMTALAPLQIMTLISSTVCAPVPIQEEGEVQGYLTAPLRLLGIFKGTLDASESALVVNIIIIVALWMIDGIRMLVRLQLRALKAKKTAATEASPATTEANPATTEAGEETREEPQQEQQELPKEDPADSDDSNLRFFQPIYIPVWAMIVMLPAVVFHGVRILALGSANQAIQMTAVIALLLITFFPIMAVVRFSVGNRSVHYIPYQNFKGRVPRAIQPSGVWGPNALRLTWGVLFQDYRHKCRTFAIIVVLYVVATCVVLGLLPSTYESCKSTVYAVAMLTIVFVAVSIYLSPFSSRYHNIMHVITMCLIVAYLACLIVWLEVGRDWEQAELYAPFREPDPARVPALLDNDPTHWSHRIMYFVAFVFTALRASLMIGQVYVCFWEAYGQYTAKYVHYMLTSGIRTKSLDDHVRDITKEMRNLFTMSEVLSSNEDDTAMIISSTQFQGVEEALRPEVGVTGETSAIRSRESKGIRYFTERGNETEPQRRRAGPPSLADYLLQDYDMLPESTKREFRIAQKIQKERERNAQRMLDPLILPPGLQPQPHNNPDYIPPRDRPIDLLSFTPSVDRPPVAFL